MPKNILRVAILAGLAASAAVASPLFCATDTLANYISNGSCQMGSIEFSAFSVIGFDPSIISVTPNPVNSTFQFGINPASYDNFNGPLLGSLLSITFTAQELNPSLKIQAIGSAFVNNISADDDSGNPASLTNNAKCTSGCLSNSLDFANSTLLAGVGAGTTLLGTTGLTGPLTVQLSSTLNLPSTEQYQEVHYSNLTVTVSDGGAVGTVPEPGTIALLMGGLGAIVVRKRFARQ